MAEGILKRKPPDNIALQYKPFLHYPGDVFSEAVLYNLQRPGKITVPLQFFNIFRQRDSQCRQVFRSVFFHLIYSLDDGSICRYSLCSAFQYTILIQKSHWKVLLRKGGRCCSHGCACEMFSCSFCRKIPSFTARRFLAGCEQ